jgi:hypothetical protein
MRPDSSNVTVAPPEQPRRTMAPPPQTEELDHLTALIVSTPASDTIGGQIRQAHNKAIGTARKALEHAAECGRLLADAKSRVNHGAWGQWLKRHVGMSHRQASNYMRIASNWQRVADFKGSIRDTIKLLTVMDSPPKDDPSPPPDPAPAFKAKQSVPLTLEAEIVEPSQDDPTPVIEDGTKPRTSLPMYEKSGITKEAFQAGMYFRGDLEDFLKSIEKYKPEDIAEGSNEKQRERIRKIILEIGKFNVSLYAALGGDPAPAKSTPAQSITVMLPHLSKHELANLKRAIAVQWNKLHSLPPPPTK